MQQTTEALVTVILPTHNHAPFIAQAIESVLMQKTNFPCPQEQTRGFGGFLAASCYHIGPHETIRDTYRKIQRWCASNNYICDKSAYERYVTDFWTTSHEDLFVTEVIAKVSRPGSVRRPLEQE